jgi:hypothetical protein
MKKLIEIFILLFAIMLMASACATRPQVSNKPRLITLAKYRVGNIINFPDNKYQDCTAKIINIIDDNSDSYYYQLVISCQDAKITKIVPQYYIDNQKEGEL